MKVRCLFARGGTFFLSYQLSATSYQWVVLNSRRRKKSRDAINRVSTFFEPHRLNCRSACCFLLTTHHSHSRLTTHDSFFTFHFKNPGVSEASRFAETNDCRTQGSSVWTRAKPHFSLNTSNVVETMLPYSSCNTN